MGCIFEAEEVRGGAVPDRLPPGEEGQDPAVCGADHDSGGDGDAAEICGIQ